MELHLGKMTLKELSEWFGLKPETLGKSSNTARAKKFEILKAYADYHMEEGKVFIDKIHYPTYSKAHEIIEKQFDEQWGNIIGKDGKPNEVLKKERIDTSARVGRVIWDKNKEVHSQITLKTSINYTNRTKTLRYGRNSIDEHGTKGRSEYVWMNQNCTAPLNEEQMKILRECAQLAYGEVNLLITAVEDDYRNGLISKQERDTLLGAAVDTSCDSFEKFITLTITRLGFYPEKRTRLIDEINWE
jgi:hypothetical protein